MKEQTRAKRWRQLQEQLKQEKCQPKERKTEKQERLDITRATARAFRKMLPSLLKQFEKIPAPRDPHIVKHKLTVLLLYGILLYFLRLDSCREGKHKLRGLYFLHPKTSLETTKAGYDYSQMAVLTIKVAIYCLK